MPETLTNREPKLTVSDVERFWLKVDMSGECWLWTGYRNPEGYGQISIGGRRPKGAMIRAHRVAWALSHDGEFPAQGMDTDHLCRNRSCVRPSHLEVVTHRENVIRSTAGEVARARQLAITHCPQGHEYTVSNTGRRANGSRRCRECDRVQVRAYRARAAA